jgi:DNA-binding NtrC family response regulator
VVLLASDPVAGDLRRILTHSRWAVIETATIEEACECANNAVWICETALPDGCWRDVVLRAAPSPVIVAARQIESDLWMEMLNGGVYSVFAAPFDEREVVGAVCTAWRYRHERRIKAVVG